MPSLALETMTFHHLSQETASHRPPLTFINSSRVIHSKDPYVHSHSIPHFIDLRHLSPSNIPLRYDSFISDVGLIPLTSNIFFNDPSLHYLYIRLRLRYISFFQSLDTSSLLPRIIQHVDILRHWSVASDPLRHTHELVPSVSRHPLWH